MAQINLLKQSGGSNFQKNFTPKILLPIFLAVLVAAVGYYLYMVVAISGLNKNISDLQTKISSEVQTASSLSGRGELLTRQQQLLALNGLIKNHVYWSQIFPKLAQVTLTKASYSSLQMTSDDNSLSLTATVPTLGDLDKFLQVFNLPEVYQYFSNVRIGGFNNTQGKGSSVVQFNVTMDYNPAIINFQGN